MSQPERESGSMIIAVLLAAVFVLSNLENPVATWISGLIAGMEVWYIATFFKKVVRQARGDGQ